VLQVSGLEKMFDGQRVLRRVDLAIHAAEAVALVGANGSGKTTTLRSIVGLTLPDRGTIVVGGIDARRQPREARRLMSYMPQRPVFPDTLTVREILSTVARLRGIGPLRVDEELASCALEAIAGHRVADLSGGERQRVALASALLPDVKLFLFDEPSASLDAAATKLLIGRVAALTAEGRAVLFTTHVVHDLDALATRIERIEDGRCTAPPIARSDEVALADDHRVSADPVHDRLCRPFARA
jgi:ABC-type multidrug transport system ATPase subunit